METTLSVKNLFASLVRETDDKGPLKYWFEIIILCLKINGIIPFFLMLFVCANSLNSAELSRRKAVTA